MTDGVDGGRVEGRKPGSPPLVLRRSMVWGGVLLLIFLVGILIGRRIADHREQVLSAELETRLSELAEVKRTSWEPAVEQLFQGEQFDLEDVVGNADKAEQVEEAIEGIREYERAVRDVGRFLVDAKRWFRRDGEADISSRLFSGSCETPEFRKYARAILDGLAVKKRVLEAGDNRTARAAFSDLLKAQDNAREVHAEMEAKKEEILERDPRLAEFIAREKAKSLKVGKTRRSPLEI